MSKSFRKDLTGQRFGRLTVLGFIPTEDIHSHWNCECDCGKETIVRRPDLISGNTLSCGCLHIEKCSQITLKHGKANTRLYKTWKGMKARCYNSNEPAYPNYGERGIIVCDEWRDDFQKFYNWAMSNGYSDELTIDRIDVNGDYHPSNCRFVDKKTQSRNTRRNVFVKYQGKIMNLSEAAEKSDISYYVLRYRYQHGDRGEQLFRPVKK